MFTKKPPTRRFENNTKCMHDLLKKGLIHCIFDQSGRHCFVNLPAFVVRRSYKLQLWSDLVLQGMPILEIKKIKSKQDLSYDTLTHTYQKKSNEHSSMALAYFYFGA